MAINYRLCQKEPAQHKTEIPKLRGFSAWRKRKLVKKKQK